MKLQNASNNLQEIVTALLKEKPVEFYSNMQHRWEELELRNSTFVLDDDGLELKWRVKPTPFEEWWNKICELDSFYLLEKETAEVIWNAAIKHIEQDND
jgi:hypothetical protein